MSELDPVFKLKTTAWITAGSRYNAVRRLERRSRLSLITISVLSGAGVLVPFLLPADPSVSKFSAFLAMLVLVVGIIEAASEFGARAAMLFSNAERLNAFQSRLGTKISSSAGLKEGLQELDEEYQQIKRESQYNHDPIDFERFKVQHKLSPEFAKADGKPAFGLFAGLCIRIAYGLHSIWWLVLLWGMAILGFWFTCISSIHP